MPVHRAECDCWSCCHIFTIAANESLFGTVSAVISDDHVAARYFINFDAWLGLVLGSVLFGRISEIYTLCHFM